MEEKNNKPTTSFSGKLGYLLGTVVASCITIVVCSAVIALAAKIIIGLLSWLF